MTRYFFDTADGDNDVDGSGVELDGKDAAINEAIRFAGSLVRDQPQIVRKAPEFVVTLRDENDAQIARVRVLLDRPAP